MNVFFTGNKMIDDKTIDEIVEGALLKDDEGNYKIATSFLEEKEKGLPLTVCAYDVDPNSIILHLTDNDGNEIATITLT